MPFILNPARKRPDEGEPPIGPPDNLDIVRDNPGNYVWTGPAAHRKFLFSSDGNEFGSGPLNINHGANGAYITGTNGGLRTSMNAPATAQASRRDLTSLLGQGTLILGFSLQSYPANDSMFYSHNGRACGIRQLIGGQLDVYNHNNRHLGSGMNDYNRGITTPQSVAFQWDRTWPSLNRAKFYANGIYEGTKAGVNANSQSYVDKWGAQSNSTNFAPLVLHFLFGFNTILAEATVIDIMSNPHTYFDPA